MIDDLLPLLRGRYPIILGDPALREIGCYPGWSGLLNSLCKSLQDHLDEHPEVPPVSAVRIKEKWGELRFHYRGGDGVCGEFVAAAVAASLSICEVCRDAGELGLVSEKWYGVRCLEHRFWSPVRSDEKDSEGRDAG